MALRIDGNFLAQVANKAPQLNKPPVNTGESAVAPEIKPQMRTETNDVQAQTRQITQQRVAGTSQDQAGQQANAVAAPAWQSTMGLSLNLRYVNIHSSSFQIDSSSRHQKRRPYQMQ